MKAIIHSACALALAVVCGAGINCIGIAPDGRQARFPALGEITGAFSADDLLGEIFSRFCIGK